MIKKLAATGILGFAVAASALAAAPAHAATYGGHGHGHGHGGGDGWFSDNETSGNHSILGGTQVIAPISVPVNVCGNAVAAVVASANAQCKGGAEVEYGD